MSDNGILVKLQLSEGLPPILGDKVQLQQVILNLIMNAVDAMSGVGEGSRELQINSAEGEPGNLLVAVLDSGPGLSQQIPRVFSRPSTRPSRRASA